MFFPSGSRLAAPRAWVEHSPSRRTAVLVLVGEHDLSTTHDVRRALLQVDDAALLVLDFAACTFVDSSVLGVLVKAARQTYERGGSVIAVNATGLVERTLRVSGVTHLFRVLR